MKPVQRARGFGLVTAALLLVVLSVLAAAVVRMTSAAQQGVGNELLAARAEQAARAAAQWGLYQALKGNWAACNGSSQSLDLSADYGLHALVSCSSKTFNEGADPANPAQPLVLRIYTIAALACSAASCPDDAAAQLPNYVERSFTVQITN